MAKVSKNDVLHIAKLSNLELNDDEIEKFSQDLSKIVSFVEKLNEVDTADVLPTEQNLKLKNILRDDVVNSTNMLTNKDYFKVKAILTNRSENRKPNK